MSTKTNYQNIKHEIEQIASGRSILLLVASKGHPWEQIDQVYKKGCRDFGESRLQEALFKIPQAPSDAIWHFIGKLQENKVNKAIGKFALIHSVDTFKLAKKISDYSVKQKTITSILLQINISGELSKQGFTKVELKAVFESLLALPGIRIEGLMTMAPLTQNEGVIRGCFAGLREFRDELVLLAKGRVALKHLSMGMSHDYRIAIEEGATIVRLGTAVFS